MTKAEKFKQQLARVFDNDLRTKQWENYVDYAIIGLIEFCYAIALNYLAPSSASLLAANSSTSDSKTRFTLSIFSARHALAPAKA